MPFNWKAVFRPFHIITIVVSFVVDQITKWLVVQNIDRFERIPLLPSLNLVHTKNKGAAFGILHDASDAFRAAFFSVITVVCIALLTVWIGTLPPKEKSQRFAISLILGGALGNGIDRLIFFQVTDFIDVYYGDWSWPAFNVADSCITVGVAILLLNGFREQLQKKRRA